MEAVGVKNIIGWKYIFFIYKINYNIYLRWFETFANEFPIDKVIYVDTEPEICNERIIKRSRQGESNIPLEYLKKCDLYHIKMLDKSLNSCICKNQLSLDGNVDIYKNSEKLDEWISQIDKFIKN